MKSATSPLLLALCLLASAATAARTWHSELGPGYDLGLGLAGSVFGNDHLAFGWRLSKSGATSGGTVREFGLTYRLHY